MHRTIPKRLAPRLKRANPFRRLTAGLNNLIHTDCLPRRAVALGLGFAMLLPLFTAVVPEASAAGNGGQRCNVQPRGRPQHHGL